MRRRHLASLFAVLMLAIYSSASLAAVSGVDDADEDTDTRLVAARVVEVSEARIAVIARTGVEHVIAVDNTDTRVKVEGRTVALKDLREGDIVTVELDEQNPLKFARNIVIGTRSNSQVAAAKP